MKGMSRGNHDVPHNWVIHFGIYLFLLLINTLTTFQWLFLMKVTVEFFFFPTTESVFFFLSVFFYP